jgi:hypothetical protein
MTFEGRTSQRIQDYCFEGVREQALGAVKPSLEQPAGLCLVEADWERGLGVNTILPRTPQRLREGACLNQQGPLCRHEEQNWSYRVAFSLISS